MKQDFFRKGTLVRASLESVLHECHGSQMPYEKLITKRKERVFRSFLKPTTEILQAKRTKLGTCVSSRQVSESYQMTRLSWIDRHTKQGGGVSDMKHLATSIHHNIRIFFIEAGSETSKTRSIITDELRWGRDLVTIRMNQYSGERKANTLESSTTFTFWSNRVPVRKSDIVMRKGGHVTPYRTSLRHLYEKQAKARRKEHAAAGGPNNSSTCSFFTFDAEQRSVFASR